MTSSPRPATGSRAARRYEHPHLDFSLELPRGAEVAAELPPVIRLAPDPGRAFAPTLAVTAESLPAGASLAEWADESLRRQLEALAAPWVIDRAPAELADGGQALRTLMHHLTAGYAVVLEQWWRAEGEHGYVLSASCETLEYDDLADAFTAVGLSFSPATSHGR